MDEILKRLEEIKAEAVALRDSDAEDRLEKLRALRVERKSLEAKYEEEQAFAELTRDVPVAQGDEDAGEGEGEAEEADAPAEDAGEEEAEEAEQPEAQREPVALAASAANPLDVEVPAGDPEDRPIALVASGNVGGTTPGSVIGMPDLQRIHRAASSSQPGRGEVTAIYASMNVAQGDALSEHNTAMANSALMASAKPGAIAPITAAAAFCGPEDVILDICNAGQSNRPVQDLFRTVPVRGEFKYMPTASRTDVNAGVNIWEEADQIALDPDDPLTWKPCVDLSCRSETTVTPHAIVGCTTLGTWQQLSAPEQVENWLKIMQIEYASIAEARLLDEIRAASRVFSIGATAQGLWTLLQAVLAHAEGLVAATNRDSTEGYVLVVPKGFRAALAADEGMRGFSQNLAINRIEAILRENYGIRIVEAWETDTTAAAAYASTLPALGVSTPLTLGTNTPGTYPVYLLKPEAFIAGSSDVVEAGYHRDANMVRQNLVRYFWEGMEFLEKTCDHETFVFEFNTCPNGAGAPVGADIICNADL